jgi:serine/threonine protein kinase
MKPDNILLNENLNPLSKTAEIKVADFGYAMVIPELLAPQ